MKQIRADWLESAASQKLFQLLESHDHQAFFVGGCVRNALLGAPVSDLDVATSARPEQVVQLSEGAGLKVVPTGIDHGTVTILIDNIPFEVTTFRNDVETDGRHAKVAYSDSILDDAGRRDFTMNALYADSRGQVHDPVNGLPDLEKRRVRFINDADQRIKEDYLRILRFFRFHAWYGDQNEGIDPDALAACAENVDGIDGLSKERIGQEMLKLLAAPDPAPSLASMSACGALLRVLPGANPQPLALLIHLEGLHGKAPDALRRLTVVGGEDQQDNLRLSNSDARTLEILKSPADPIELGYRFGSKAVDILLIRAASVGSDVPSKDLENARLGLNQTFPLKAADLMPQLSGPALGKALKEAEGRWINSRFQLSKEDLLP